RMEGTRCSLQPTPHSPASRRVPPQECLKTSLFIAVVVSQGPGDAAVGQNNKRDAIREGPFLVRSLCMNRHSPFEEIRSGRDYLVTSCRSHPADQSVRPETIHNLGQGVVRGNGWRT